MGLDAMVRKRTDYRNTKDTQTNSQTRIKVRDNWLDPDQASIGFGSRQGSQTNNQLLPGKQRFTLSYFKNWKQEESSHAGEASASNTPSKGPNALRYSNINLTKDHLSAF